jgi:plasmid stability protein
MSQIRIDNVPEDVLEALEVRAVSNNRTVAQEALASIERDLGVNRHDQREILARLEHLHAGRPSLRVDHRLVDQGKRWGRE